MIESDLVSHLKSDVTLNTLIGGRIYPLVAPQNVIKPYITYQVISDNNKQCLRGGIYKNSVRCQIDCWSTKYSEVKAIKQAVINRLVGFKSSSDINPMDGYESETLLYRQIIDFTIKE